VSEKTEPPSQKKLRDARKKGQVVKSKEVVSAALMITVFTFLFAMSGFYLVMLQRLILLPAKVIGPEFDFDNSFQEVLGGVFLLLAQMVIPLVLLVAVVGVLAHFAQFGLILSFDSIKPDLKKLNPAGAVKKIFSVKNVIELLKSTIKIGFLGYLVYLVIRDGLPDLMKIPYCGEGCILPMLGILMRKLVISAAFAFIIIAAADYVFQRYQFMKQMKMSKEDVKREYKEMEGNPEIKGRRRQLQHELASAGMVNSVKRSSVVITNPTHLAIALEYEEGKTALPIVRAKGENLLAHRIIEIARQEGIPIMENVPLAHALHEQASLDQYIPLELISAVAEVLRWVARLEREEP